MGKTINQLTTNIGGSLAGTTEMEGQLSGSTVTGKFTLTQLKAALDALGGDVIAPTIVSAIVTTANQVVVVFSESVTVTTAGWSFRRNTANWAITSVSGSGTTWTFLMATSAVAGETLDRSYNSATGATVDGSANELVTFTNSAVTNSISGGDVIAPTIVMAYMLNSTTIRYIYDESVTMTLAGHSWLKNTVAWTPSSISGSGTTWDVVMSSAYTEGDALLRSYNSATGSTIDTATNELVSYVDSGVWETKTGAFLLQSTGQTYAAQGKLDAMCKAAIGIGWSKFKDIHPIAGTTAAQHKWNFVDPQDTDGAHRWVFNGSIFHAIDGIDSSGGAGDYIDGKFNPNTVFGSSHLQAYGIYLRDALPDGDNAFGVLDATNAIQFQKSGTDSYSGIGVAISGFSPATSAPSAWTEHISMSRENTTAGTSRHYRNGVDYGADGDVFSGVPNANLVIKARNNNGSIDTNSVGRIAFFWAATTLTAGEMATWDTAIQAYIV